MSYHHWTKAQEEIVREMVLSSQDDEKIAKQLGTSASKVKAFRRRKRIGHPLLPGVPAEMNRKYCKHYYYTHFKLTGLKKK